MSAVDITRADDFSADLRASLAVWSRQPLLPILSVIVWTVPAALPSDGIVGFLGLLWSLFFIGWPGTEREWYRHAFGGQQFPRTEIWRATRRFANPFFRLALIATPFLLAAIFLVAFLRPDPVPTVVVFVLLVFVLDVFGTFVTPALTYTTSSAREAISIGWTMLRENWREAMPYALTPALVLVLGLRFVLVPVVGPANSALSTAVAALIALALKGATAKFYLQRRPATLG
jgi:hypothetical protein